MILIQSALSDVDLGIVYTLNYSFADGLLRAVSFLILIIFVLFKNIL